jgi:hypothetical protein
MSLHDYSFFYCTIEIFAAQAQIAILNKYLKVWNKNFINSRFRFLVNFFTFILNFSTPVFIYCLLSTRKTRIRRDIFINKKKNAYALPKTPVFFILFLLSKFVNRCKMWYIKSVFFIKFESHLILKG